MDDDYSFKGYDPNLFLRKRQPIRTDVLLTTLYQHGFREKGQEGSHIQLEHPDFGWNITLVKGSTDVAYQKAVGKICLRVRKRKKEIQEQALEATRSEIETYEPHVDKIVITKDCLPKSYEALAIPEYDDSVIVRSISYPQIGTITTASISEKALQFLLYRIQRDVEEFDEILLKAKNDYGFEIMMTLDKVLFIHHPDYKFYFGIPAFNLYSDFIPKGCVESMIGHCQMLDDYIAAKVRRFLKDSSEDGRLVASVPFEGLIEWTVEVRNRIDAKKHKIKICTSLQFRISELHYWEIQDQFFQFNFGGDGDPKYLSTVLNQYFGFTVRRPEESRLVCSHPFFPDCSFEIPNPNGLPTLAELFVAKMQAKEPDEKINAANRMARVNDQWDSISAIIDECMNLYFLQSMATYQRFVAALEKIAGLEGFSIQNPSTKYPLGKESRIVFSHPLFEQPMGVRSIRTLVDELGLAHAVESGPSNSLASASSRSSIYLRHPADVERLEKAVETLLNQIPSIPNEFLKRLTEKPTRVSVLSASSAQRPTPSPPIKGFDFTRR